MKRAIHYFFFRKRKRRRAHRVPLESLCRVRQQNQTPALSSGELRTVFMLPQRITGSDMENTRGAVRHTSTSEPKISVLLFSATDTVGTPRIHQKIKNKGKNIKRLT